MRIRIQIDNHYDLREMAIYFYSLGIQVIGLVRREHELIADLSWADIETVEKTPGVIGYIKEPIIDLNQ